MAKSKRRALDFYETAPWQVDCLLMHVNVAGTVLEPCAGAGAIVTQLKQWHPITVITTNDCDPKHETQFTSYAQDLLVYDAMGCAPDWVVSNPPYKMPDCLDIVALAVSQARVGVAMNLRLSFLEPTDTRHPRGPWLAEHPPDQMIVMPRYSYTGNGKSDSMTTAWMVWYRDPAWYEGTGLGSSIVCAYDADKG